MTLATAHKHITRRGIGYRGSNHFRGSERKTAIRQMRDRVERIMKEGLACDCCSAEIKALFQEWIDCYGCEHRLIQSNGVSNRESRRPQTPLNKTNTVSNTLKTKLVVFVIRFISASAG